VLHRNGIDATLVRKHSDGQGAAGEPTVVDRIMSGDVDMVVNTPSGRDARADGYEIRSAAISMDRPIITTVQELGAAVHGIEALGQGALGVRSLQEWTAVAREDRVIQHGNAGTDREAGRD
jgi:carbamoyl-phosphate synthase large subunit